MMSMTHFFLSDPASAHFVHGQYRTGLVFLSVGVAIVLSWVALHTATIARNIDNHRYRHFTIAMAAFALAGGIWAMHFIGVLALQLPAPMHYAIAPTVLSFLPACGASGIALYILAGHHVSGKQLGISGFLVGAGIGAMHYVGMAAMMTPLRMRFEPSIFALSIVVAVALAMLALWIHFGLRRTALNPWARFILSGVVMGVAISGMHYTGMASVRFLGQPSTANTLIQANNEYAALALALAAITIGMLVATLNGLIRSRELNREVESRELRLRAIFVTAVDGIITIDECGIIHEFSPSAERLFGYTASEIVGRNVNVLVPESYRTAHDEGLSRYVKTRESHIIGVGADVTGLRQDGSELPIRIAISEMAMPDGKLMFVGLVTDISEQQALEASLRETAARAEQAASAKSSFLANMSHEIRTPMNSVIGFTELVLQSDLTSVQRRHMDAIRQSSNTLLNLINDILDTTKLEHGRLELETRDFSLMALAYQVESSLHLAAHAKSLTLTTHYPADMPEYFKGDPLRLQQVLTNLVNNAIKFTEFGGVELLFSYDDGRLHVEVRDTGIGMTEEQIQTIFDPFNQADASISRRFGGTGLGTTISRQLVETMGGCIGVDSTPGNGSTFHVCVPIPRGEKPQWDIAPDEHPHLPPLRILIADDVATNRDLLRETLERWEHEIESAVDGADALKKYQSGEFDVVLMDVHMPTIDGLQATRLIRQYELTSDHAYTPVIALTASVMTKDRYAARQAGMDGFAVKPLDLPRLFAEIAHVLGLETSLPEQNVSDNENPEPTIDWQRGSTLWGSQSRLAEKISAFFDHVEQQHRLPDPSSANENTEQLISSLHGIKGASGNLAMMGVSSLAGELETLARDGQPEQVLSRLPELYIRMAAAKTEAMNSQAHGRTSEQPERGNTTATSVGAHPASETDLGAGIDALLELLRHNELDDVVLNTACDGLRNQGDKELAGTLQVAVDNFDFDRACALLTQWKTTADVDNPA